MTDPTEKPSHDETGSPARDDPVLRRRARDDAEDGDDAIEEAERRLGLAWPALRGTGR